VFDVSSRPTNVRRFTCGEPPGAHVPKPTRHAACRI